MSPLGILSGISTLEKVIPIIEEIGTQIGPLVEIEVVDGKAIWADVKKAYTDLKNAIAIVRTAAGQKLG